jgi:hypothetical protein
MTVIQNLVAASAAFVELAPANHPERPSPELVAAFRRYRYWGLRWFGLTGGPAAYYAGKDAARFESGLLDGWTGYRATALHWADRPARIKAAELAAGKAAPVA